MKNQRRLIRSIILAYKYGVFSLREAEERAENVVNETKMNYFCYGLLTAFAISAIVFIIIK